MVVCVSLIPGMVGVRQLNRVIIIRFLFRNQIQPGIMKKQGGRRWEAVGTGGTGGNRTVGTSFPSSVSHPREVSAAFMI